MLTSFPKQGLLSVNSANALLNTPYEISSLKYTLDLNLCAKNYKDNFNYKVIDTNKNESTESTVNIDAIGKNQEPIGETVNISAKKSEKSVTAYFSAVDPEKGPITYSDLFSNNNL